MLFVLFGRPSFVRADGIRNPFQGAAAIAQGNAFAAQADDPTAVFYEQQSVQEGRTVELNGKGTTAGLNASGLSTLLQTDKAKPRLKQASSAGMLWELIWRTRRFCSSLEPSPAI